nr:hypothetical protein [Tanacetum cinerariifolium]
MCSSSKKIKEDLFTYCIENGILQDSFEPSNDNTNIVNALQEPFVVKQDPGENASQSPPQINHHCCYGCGDSLDDIFCYQCTCELCGKGAHYGYNYPSKVPIIPDSEPFNNQTVDELPQTLPSFDPTCYSEDRNSFTYDSRSNLVMIHLTFLTHLRNLLCIFVNFTETMLNEEEKQIKEEQAAKAQNWKIPVCYDDDDEDYTIAITHKEPNNSLIIYDEDISKEIYSNPLFDEEIISMKIDPHHFNAESDLIESLLNHDSLIISSSLKIDSLLDEFAGELSLLKSIPPRINKTDCDREEEIRLIKRLFDSLMEEIDLSFTSDDPMPPGIKEDDYDSERDILILEELLSNDSLSPPENESFHFDIPLSSRPPAKPSDGNSVILNFKVMGNIYKHKVPMPKLMFTQPTLVPNQEKSLKLLPHMDHKAS